MPSPTTIPKKILPDDAIQIYTDIVTSQSAAAATVIPATVSNVTATNSPTVVNGPATTSSSGVNLSALRMTGSSQFYNMGPFQTVPTLSNVTVADSALGANNNVSPVPALSNITVADSARGANYNMGPFLIDPKPATSTINPIPDDPVIAPASPISNINNAVGTASSNLSSSLANAFNFVPQDRMAKLGRAKKPTFKSDDPNFKGKTDTILTSGRGVTGAANVARKTLLGSST